MIEEIYNVYGNIQIWKMHQTNKYRLAIMVLADEAAVTSELTYIVQEHEVPEILKKIQEDIKYYKYLMHGCPQCNCNGSVPSNGPGPQMSGCVVLMTCPTCKGNKVVGYNNPFYVIPDETDDYDDEY